MMMKKINILTLCSILLLMICLIRPTYQTTTHCEKWGLGRHSVTVQIQEPDGSLKDYVISKDILKVLKDNSDDNARWGYVTCGIAGLFCAHSAISNQQQSTKYGDEKAVTSGD